MNELRCAAKHPALETAQCFLDAGHTGPHNMEGARNQRWQFQVEARHWKKFAMACMAYLTADQIAAASKEAGGQVFICPAAAVPRRTPEERT